MFTSFYFIILLQTLTKKKLSYTIFQTKIVCVSIKKQFLFLFFHIIGFDLTSLNTNINTHTHTHKKCKHIVMMFHRYFLCDHFFLIRYIITHICFFDKLSTGWSASINYHVLFTQIKLKKFFVLTPKKKVTWILLWCLFNKKLYF